VLKIPEIKEIIARLPEDLMSKRAENLSPEELAQVANQIVDLKKSDLAKETEGK
jgi:16S rRNA (adenine1518-N6/adenine1519-N6)-dimethyltransferase